MNIERFRKICRINSYALNLFAVVIIFFVFYGIYAVISGSVDMNFSFRNPGITLYSMGGSKSAIGITEAEYQSAATVMFPVTQIVSVYIFLKGGEIFKWLGDGKLPFDSKLVKMVKKISLTLMISDIVFPMLHSVILSFISVDGYSFRFGFGSAFIMGVILYVVSDIFNYGRELQTLSDDTV